MECNSGKPGKTPNCNGRYWWYLNRNLQVTNWISEALFIGTSPLSMHLYSGCYWKCSQNLFYIDSGFLGLQNDVKHFGSLVVDSNKRKSFVLFASELINILHIIQMALIELYVNIIINVNMKVKNSFKSYQYSYDIFFLLANIMR